MTTNQPPQFAVPYSGSSVRWVAPDGSDAYAWTAQQWTDRVVVIGDRVGSSGSDIFLSTLAVDSAWTGSLLHDRRIDVRGGNDHAYASSLTPSGLVVAGDSADASGSPADALVIRLHADTLQHDDAFGAAGVVRLDGLGYADSAYALAEAGDGGLWVGGEVGNGLDADFAVWRLAPDGTRVQGFGVDGLWHLDRAGAQDLVQAVVPQPGGSVLLLGSSDGADGREGLLMKLNAAGAFDAAFGSDGSLRLNPLGTDMSVQTMIIAPDGKLLIAGSIESTQGRDFLVMRRMPDGSADGTFGVDGATIVDMDSGDDMAWSLALQPDGRILVAGDAEVGQSTVVALLRLHPDGRIDTDFGDGGLVREPIGDRFARASAVLVQPDGGILVAGDALRDGSRDAGLLRFDAQGRPDTGFGAISTLAGSVVAHVEGSELVQLDSDVAVYDPELELAANYRGFSVRLQRAGGASGDDRLDLVPGNGVAMQDGQVLIGAMAVARLLTSAGRMEVQFLNGATSTQVSTVLRRLGYQYLGDTPPASVRIEWIADDGNTGAQGDGGPGTAVGATTVMLTPTNDEPRHNLSLQGIAEVGQVIVVMGSVSDPDGLGSLTWQWLRDGSPIAGATAATYALVAADTGTQISVRASYIDGGGTAEAVISSELYLSAPINVVTGTASNDILPATAGDDSISGLAGNDTLQGLAGNDVLRGGDGRDVLSGGTGNDTLDGGAGIDIADYRGAAAVNANLQTGVAIQGGDTDMLTSIEALFGSSAGDVLRGLDGPATLPGETIRGGAGNDTINGGTGIDWAEFSGPLASYTITRIPGTMNIIVAHNGGGADGTDTLSDIELLLFSDRVLAFGPRVEEIARVAFALWTPQIIGSPTLFSKGISYYTNEFGYNLDSLCQVALQYWPEVGAATAARLRASIPAITYTEKQLIDTMAANGGVDSVSGRAAAVKAVALDTAMAAQLELAGVVSGVVASFGFPGETPDYFGPLPG